MTEISSHVEKSKAQLKSERDSLGEKVKEEISANKRKALAKV